jgi:hypothetical protein
VDVAQTEKYDPSVVGSFNSYNLDDLDVADRLWDVSDLVALWETEERRAERVAYLQACIRLWTTAKNAKY